jgi:phage gpG-like protein
MIRIEINMPSMEAAVHRLQQTRSGHPVLMRRHAGTMLDAVEENFAREGRPKWLGLRPSTLSGRVAQQLGKRGQLKDGRMSILQGRRAAAGVRILQRSGRLAGSITPWSDGFGAMVGTNVTYARIHQFGGKTKPHVIRPKYKKALAFNGRLAKSVNHPGSKIPARPFLQLTAGDNDKILTDTQTYLASLF